jgi:hypothetical protein
MTTVIDAHLGADCVYPRPLGSIDFVAPAVVAIKQRPQKHTIGLLGAYLLSRLDLSGPTNVPFMNLMSILFQRWIMTLLIVPAQHTVHQLIRQSNSQPSSHE